MASNPPRPGAEPPPRYTVELRPTAIKELAALPKPIARRIGHTLDALAHNPFPPGVVKMQGADNFHRIRAGDYRVIYSIRKEVLLILVVRVGHRKDVYRGL